MPADHEGLARATLIAVNSAMVSFVTADGLAIDSLHDDVIAVVVGRGDARA